MKKLLLVLIGLVLVACAPKSSNSDNKTLVCSGTDNELNSYQYSVNYMKNLVHVSGSFNGNKLSVYFGPGSNPEFHTKPVVINISPILAYKLVSNYGFINENGGIIESETNFAVFKIENSVETRIEINSNCIF